MYKCIIIFRLNSLWGKLSQRPFKSRTELIKSHERLMEIMEDPSVDMTTFCPITDGVAVVTTTNKSMYSVYSHPSYSPVCIF